MFVDRYITAGGQLGNNYNSIFVRGTYNTMFVDRYIIAGGPPEKVVELLSVNYKAVAQTVNVMAEWLIMCGM